MTMHTNPATDLSAEERVKQTYQSLFANYTDKAGKLAAWLRWLSILRLLLFVAAVFLGYKAIVSGNSNSGLISVAMLITFLLFIRIYDKFQLRVKLYQELAKLNQQEIRFLTGQPSAYPDGNEFADPHHAYSYDLDLFGPGGLFPFLNRTSTSFGKSALAKALLDPDQNKILPRQQAIEELSGLLDFRQHLQAHGAMLDTREKEIEQLKIWLQAKPGLIAKPLYFLLLIFPLAAVFCLSWYLTTETESFLDAFYYLFVINLVLVASFGKRISRHLSVSNSVTKILQQFAGQLHQLETQGFQSPLLREIQDGLKTGSVPASKSIDRLASLFNYLESVINLVVSILLNGLFLFHIHILFALEKWKGKNGTHVFTWLELLGEMESLCSYANLKFNNPDFCKPELSQEETLVSEKLGHPLIPSTKRISNSISFAQYRFIVLTGSNMSGKSTFLRTLGVNLVLARAGSVVCADRFIFYPFRVQVSMRISDSLQDSESLFYAELKRLHEIILQLESGVKCFVLLDEILRGTNSQDKHNGTVGLIHKLQEHGAFGILATHDLTLARLSETSRGYLSNQCFESEIIHDELVFDYKLKEGVCSKLSASFLMKKMGVID